ncbi:MAG: hypothetical protein EOO27_11880 [Comamonadaceae bacterium]|nr:MAG: hypothetical protein EOO27_11880 [Comamonadaceae bacterium]
MYNPQFDAAKRPVHLLTPEGWPRARLLELLDRVDHVRGAGNACADQRGLRVLPLFYVQAETGLQAIRLAASWRHWTVVAAPRALDANRDAPADIAGLGAQADVLLLSHPASGASHAVASALQRHLPIINVLDGMHAAPLAALCDVATLRRRLPELHTRTIALCGDLVADARLRSVVHLLTTLGVPKVSVVHAGSCLPQGAAQLGVHVFTVAESAAGFEGADAILRFPSASVGADQAVGSAGQIDLPVMMHGVPDEDGDGQTQHVFEQACVLAAVIDTLQAAR